MTTFVSDRDFLWYEELGEGLVLRTATRADYEKLIAFNTEFHDSSAGMMVKDLLNGLHPGFKVSDFLVVVDAQDRIISSLCLIEVLWRLGRTELRIGMPEFVATLQEYRGRGLVRKQMAVLDRWMTERGHIFGYIGGIPYYYRLFGYEYAADIPRAGYLTAERHAALLEMPAGVDVRPITGEDVPALMHLAEEKNTGFDLTTDVSESAWRWFVANSDLDGSYQMLGLIALKNGQPVGSARVVGKKDNLLIHSITGNLEAGKALVAAAMNIQDASKLRLGVEKESTLGNWLTTLNPYYLTNYGWYLRVNDPVAAFQLLKHELEARVASSVFAGLSSELELGFYRYGIKLVFEGGKLVEVERLPGKQNPKVGIPPELLPKLLFGYRELEQLEALNPDLFCGDDRELVKILFPRLRADIRYFL
ncbi:MAG TPA: GNAT family N-acetyltransferase [Chloroflexia bacterium]|nr:GNAT family N-acetyltransferase [Chloroflexia bacterium]